MNTLGDNIMISLNTLDDIEKYKNSGNLTRPFLPKDFIMGEIMLDLRHKQKEQNSEYFLCGKVMLFSKQL